MTENKTELFLVEETNSVFLFCTQTKQKWGWQQDFCKCDATKISGGKGNSWYFWTGIKAFFNIDKVLKISRW